MTKTDTSRRHSSENGSSGGWSKRVWRFVRGTLLAIGAVIFGFGILVVFDPDAARFIPIEQAISLLGSDYVVIALVGLFAVGLSALVVIAGQINGVTEANPPIVEEAQSASYPGETFDRATESRLNLWKRTDINHRTRLREAAVRSTMRSEGCTRTQAAKKVATGTWTDDPVVSAYLSESHRSRSIPHRPSRERQAARRTVDVIERLNHGKHDSRAQTTRSERRRKSSP